MMHLRLALVACGAIASLAAQQSAGPNPAFEAASIKRHVIAGRGPARPNMMRIVTDPGRLSMNAVSVGNILEFAFDIHATALILNRPEWLYREAYDVVATSGATSTRGEQKRMLQTLLRERCSLVFHLETKDAPIYGITPGPKLKLTASKEEQAGAEALSFHPRLVMHEGRPPETLWTATDVTMADLAAWLCNQLEKPVIDQSGLEGRYDISLSIAMNPVDAPSGGRSTTYTDDRDYITALRDQLGLKLESRRGPVTTLVIDRIERPSEN
jgi:uncharacterized protein (TIGR03435 family)